MQIIHIHILYTHKTKYYVYGQLLQFMSSIECGTNIQILIFDEYSLNRYLNAIYFKFNKFRAIHLKTTTFRDAYINYQSPNN